MKQLTVKENGKTVYTQAFSEVINPEYSELISKVADGIEDYSQYCDYFDSLLKSIFTVCQNQDINLVLNVDDEATLLTLYLTDEELQLADKIKAVLLANHPEDIEQVGIVPDKKELNILDFLYDFG